MKKEETAEVKTALVTGASGFVGNYLVKRLIEEKWAVRALVHRQPLSMQKGIEIIRGDVEDVPLLNQGMQGVDAVFHLAAALGASAVSRREYFRVNAEGTRAILAAAEGTDVKRIVHFSSAGVLGRVASNSPAGEDIPLNPQNIYDSTKLEGERTALQALDSGQDVVVVRPGWVYGPGDRRTFKLIKAIAEKRFVLVTKGTAMQTPVHIRDLITGVLLCYARGKRGHVYHLAGSEALTVIDIVKTIASAAGTSIPRIKLPLFPLNSMAWILDRMFRLFKKEAPVTPGKLSFFTHPKPLDIRRAREELGYNPSVHFAEGMAEAVQWYRKQGWLD